MLEFWPAFSGQNITEKPCARLKPGATVREKKERSAELRLRNAGDWLGAGGPRLSFILTGDHLLFTGLRDYLWRMKQRNKLICYWLVRLTGQPSRFTFRGQSYRYFWHRYNATWRNERAIEIPIARSFLAGVSPDKVLEIGNVLSHYGPVAHEVVDKYEQTDGVRNEDVCDLKSDKKYELILSLSTLEHVGWDEEPKDEMKVLRAFENLQSLLAPGGRLVVTIPLGYNPPLDRDIEDGRIVFSEHTYLKRNPRRNEWREVTAAEVRHPQYDRQDNCAHELLVGIIEKG